MKPDQVTTALRRIAAKIDNSIRPSKKALTADIRHVLASLETSEIDEDVIGEECEICGGPATHTWGRHGHFLCDSDRCLNEMDTPEHGSEWEMDY